MAINVRLLQQLQSPQDAGLWLFNEKKLPLKESRILRQNITQEIFFRSKQDTSRMKHGWLKTGEIN